MLLTSDKRILTINGAAIEKRVNTLSFRVKGVKFPNFSYVPPANSQGFMFKSSIAQSIQINWGDGTTQSVNMLPISGGLFGAGWSQDGAASVIVPAAALKPIHHYADGLATERTITFMFQDLTKITHFNTSNILLEGGFPTEILAASRLREITITAPRNMTLLPDLSNSKELKALAVAGYSIDKFTKIPDSFFEPRLLSFRGGSSFDLSDPIASNSFKIDQWPDLEVLELTDCDLNQLDEAFRNLLHLKDFRIINNRFPEIPKQIESMTSLNVLYVNALSSNAALLSLSNLPNLSNLYLSGNFDLADLHIKWAGANSLKTIVFFQSMVSQAKFNQFIDQMYLLCEANANILPNAAPAPYPNRFRNMAWGFGTYFFMGSKVAPTGYVQGVSNGEPINQGQKVYVLQNQYNHVITHA